MTLTKLTPPTYEEYVYPVGALVFGWFVASLSIIPIPSLMIWQIVKAEGSLKEVSSVYGPKVQVRVWAWVVASKSRVLEWNDVSIGIHGIGCAYR